MANHEATVLKSYDDYEVGDLITVAEKDVPRLLRKGRIKIKNAKQVDRSRLNKVPPSPITQTLTSKRPRAQMRSKAQGPGQPNWVRPGEDKRERPPAAPPVGPDLTQPVGPGENRDGETKYLPFLKVQPAPSAGWYQVTVDGEPVKSADGSTRNFRKNQAEREAARLRAEAE